MGLNLDYFKGLDLYSDPQENNRFLNTSSGNKGSASLSQPITSIKKLGTTFVGNRANFGSDIIGGLIANIRKGSGTLQLAGTTANDFAFTGKSRRQDIKEILRATDVKWDGLEFAPNQNGGVAGLSGFDFESRQFSEQRRETDKRNVREAIRFAADIGAGGGIDLWSREFSRPITGNFDGFVDYEGADVNKNKVIQFVDGRTGAPLLNPIQTSQLGGQGMAKIAIPKWKKAKENGVDDNGNSIQVGDYLDAAGNKLVADINDPSFIMNRAPEWNAEKKEFESTQMDWNQFQEYAKELNNDYGTKLSAEEWIARIQLEQQYSQTRAGSVYQGQYYERHVEELNDALELKKNKSKFEEGFNYYGNEVEVISQKLEKIQEKFQSGKGTEEDKAEFQKLQEQQSQASQQLDSVKARLKAIDNIPNLQLGIQHAQETSGRGDAQAKQMWSNIEHLKKMEDYGKEKSFESYAELGIEALKVTDSHDVAAPIYVGPELGWPEGYGGHTDEFIEIIKESRKKMIEDMKKDPEIRNRYKDKDLPGLAKKHIQGVFDTSHLSMWYNHFPREKGETEESRLKRFNGWYMEQIDKLAEADVIGSVQIVDSATGDHQHLPVGEGIFPTVDAIKRLKEKGFDGNIISEGHNHEDLDPGSTQYSLWNSFGGGVGGTGGYFSPSSSGNSFGNLYSGSGAAGYRAPPNYIVGAYSPSNDWQLWSGTPLE